MADIALVVTDLGALIPCKQDVNKNVSLSSWISYLLYMQVSFTAIIYVPWKI